MIVITIQLYKLIIIRIQAVSYTHLDVYKRQRYVDDTFIIYKGTLRQIENFKNLLNNINKHIQFTHETEIDNKLNFLDLTITKCDDKLKYSIYRKPTTTDVTLSLIHI